jgi:predicted PurR-regulated permease PerM
MKKETIRTIVLLLLIVFFSALFLSMIRSFLMVIFLSGIFSALATPLYARCVKWFKGRRSLASATTLVLIVFVILIPLGGLLGIVTGQAMKVAENAKPWVEKQIAQPDAILQAINGLPLVKHIAPYRDIIFQKAGQAVGSMSRLLLNRFSSLTFGTINFLFMLFVFLYTMFFFLMDGERLVHKILHYLPLEDHDEQLLLARFTSVSRATLKGTAVIGVLQGGLSGLAFWVFGIPSAVFWGTVMTVLSVIPGIGTALVWVPAAIILAGGGHYYKAAGLTLFCALVVGSLDNFLRPALVGKDTQMHDLMIFFGTMGGIFMFGVPGIIIGPLIAALFITIWDIYGVAFKDVLPESSLSKARSESSADKGKNLP